MPSFLDAIAGLTGPAQNGGLFGANSPLSTVGNPGSGLYSNQPGGILGQLSQTAINSANTNQPVSTGQMLTNPGTTGGSGTAAQGLSSLLSLLGSAGKGIGNTVEGLFGGGSKASTQPDLGDILNAILGTAPAAPTDADLGAAPTLANFFSAAPYQQAQAGLAAGNKTATGTINDAYTQAAQKLAGIVQAANQASTNNTNAENTDATNATSQANGFVNSALQASGGDNAGVAQKLAPLQATLAAQEGSAKTLNQQLQGIQQGNEANYSSGLTNSRQQALNYLAGQVSGEGSKIGLAQAQGQAQGQQLLDQALNARGTALASADKDYQSQMASRQSQATDLLKTAMTALSGSGTSGRDTTLNNLQTASPTLQNVFNASIFGGIKNADGSTLGAAKDGAEAIQRAESAIKSGAVKGADANNLMTMIQQYYNTSTPTPTSQDLAQYLSQLVG